VSGSSFLFLWRRTIARSNLTPPQRLVALVLSMHMDSSGGSCWPALPTISDETGLARSTVRAAVQSLEAAGYTARRPGRGRSRSSPCGLDDEGVA